VAKSGDTMTGYLTLVGAPVNDNHATTKTYVDSKLTSFNQTIVSTQASGIEQVAISLPSGTWFVQAFFEIHQAAFYQVDLYIDGSLVYIAQNEGDPTGTSFRTLIGTKICSGGRNVTVNISFPQGGTGYYGGNQDNRVNVIAFRVG
jgi:hypothetical protein